jgi:hypothetical protein
MIGVGQFAIAAEVLQPPERGRRSGLPVQANRVSLFEEMARCVALPDQLLTDYHLTPRLTLSQL